MFSSRDSRRRADRHSEHLRRNGSRSRSLRNHDYRRWRIEELESRHLLAQVFWDGGAGDSLWTSRFNWSGDQVPTAVDDVVIDVAGNESVILRGTQSIASLENTETLWIQGSGAGHTTLTVAGNATNHGLLRMEAIGSGYTSNVVAGGTLTNAADGTINAQFDCVYDQYGRVISQDSLDGAWTYTYDTKGQLTRAVFVSANAMIPDQDLIYQYDALGNRVLTLANGTSQAYTTNSMNQYTAAGTDTFQYDPNGNLILKRDATGDTTYAYDALQRLVRVLTSAE